MPNFNKVMLMGHLTREVEMRFTPGGTGCANFGIAVSRKFKDAKTNEQKEEVMFADCECWGKQAEVLNEYVGKGSALFIEGRLKLDQWEDKASGQKRSKLKVVVENFQFVGAKGGKAAKPTSQREEVTVPNVEEDPPF